MFSLRDNDKAGLPFNTNNCAARTYALRKQVQYAERAAAEIDRMRSRRYLQLIEQPSSFRNIKLNLFRRALLLG
jgi:hypothetical protein